MLSYQHVEDYLEALAGYDPNSPAYVLFPTKPSNISLARYDIQIVESMSTSTVMGQALTDKQAELAVKLILKYRRQFANNGIDVTPCENPSFRVPVRKIDRTKAVWIEDGKIVVKFPYDSEMIKELQNFRNESQGSANYDREAKLWNLGLTEYNVNWVVTWAQAKNFVIDNTIIEVFNQILECEQHPYALKLVKLADRYTITNASDSLINYITTHAGGFGLDNLTRLVDYSGVCGYDALDSALDNDCSTALTMLGTNQTSYLRPTADNLNMIYDYAEETDRYPICIYNPTLIDLDLSRFHEEEIVRFDRNGKTKTSDYDPYRVKVVYAQKIPSTWDFPVPLMVSTFEMMYGGKKMDWTQRAEKIIYYTETKLRND